MLLYKVAKPKPRRKLPIRTVAQLPTASPSPQPPSQKGSQE